MLEAGDVVLAEIQYTDTFEVKKRPALVLFEGYNNVVIAGITSNPRMQGIPITRKEGAVKDGVIKLNYIFTIAESMITKKLFHLNPGKKKTVYRELTKKLETLNK